MMVEKRRIRGKAVASFIIEVVSDNRTLQDGC